MKAMKRLIAKNVKIEFSCFKHENNLTATSELFDSINEILERELPDINFKISGSITENEVSETIKYHTDPTGHCEVLCKNTVIARAYCGQNGYSVRILQGMDRIATMQKIREECPEFLIANNVPDNYYPLLFGADKKKR
jgi:hypothetical protein